MMGSRALLAGSALVLGSCVHEPRSSDAMQGPALDAGSDRAAPCTPRLDASQLDPTLASYEFIAADAALHLGELAPPCSAEPTLLVVHVAAPWCGTCQQLADQTPALASAFAGRVGFVDVLIADGENAGPSASAVRSWAAVHAAGRPVALDVDEQLPALFSPPLRLPLVLVLDARSLAVLGKLVSPTPEQLERSLRASLMLAPAPPAALHDGRFTDSEWSLIGLMNQRLLVPRAEPQNEVADDVRAAALGKELFFDPAFSSNGEVACASCHQTERALASPDPTAAQGIGQGSRNVPSVAFAAYGHYQFWDGRADSLFVQATMPFENDSEMGGTRLGVAHGVRARYRARYEALFAALPALEDPARFPPAGKPGNAVWDAMAEPDRTAVSTVLANVGKAVAAFERSLHYAPTRFDLYLDGEGSALSADEKDGLLAFVRAGCPQCHHGPLLSDGAFHNLRVATGRPDLLADPGRAVGLPLLLQGEMFGATVDRTETPRTVQPRMLGAFKTPSLRAVASTPPYGHGGGYAGLTDIVELHRRAGLPAASTLAVGVGEPWLAPFPEDLRDAIVRFLEVLILPPSP